MVFGSIADIFLQWEYMGVFDFVLPFLLVFAIVFGIISSTKFLGDNKGVHVVISLVIGLMSLRYQVFLSSFLSELFPCLGIGIAIMLAILILVGMFIAKDESRYWGYGLAALAVIIAIVVVYQSFDGLGLIYSSGFNSETVGFIILGLLIIGLIIAVTVSRSESTDKDKGKALFLPGWGESR